MEPTSPIELLPEAVEAVSAVIERIPSQAWGNPTPCTQWSVRDVANHLVYEHCWAPHLLRGETMEDVGSRYDGDLLGDDPVGAWKQAAASSIMAWSQAKDPHQKVHVSFGEIDVDTFAHQMLTDLTVHGWDIAKGAHVEYAPVPSAVEVTWAYCKPRAGGEGPFDPPVPTASEDRLDQLVALLGRDPMIQL